MGTVAVIDLVVGMISSAYAFFKEIGRDVNGIRNRVKIGKIVAVFLSAVLISTILLVAGHVIQLPLWMTGETEQDLGGVDLAAYCNSYGFGAATDQGCESGINLGSACDWSHNAKGSHIKFSSPSPKSGLCYTANGHLLGGISDMDGYCKYRFKFIVTVTSTSQPPHTWNCETSVNPDLVCGWQYQKRAVAARLNDAGHLRCYERKHI
ncbi:hypothetical protein [Streptomyces shenzhenensis]|uniref:hypothetical protein n=1 Tax=Streptomyces shenzhenensis TaxID=943815 RepID=UPI001F3AE840|nr:hypothetical protein [Streptomyces shenzhenensis]